MKLKKILKESKEPKYQSGRKIITIDVNDASGDFEKLLNWWKSMGNIGHSALCHLDVDNKSDMVKIYCDGDGADRITKLEIQHIKEK